jgi:hypothetical protein
MTAKKLQIKRRETGHQPPQIAELTHRLSQEDKVRLNVEMTKSKRQGLKAKAVMEGKTVHEIVNQLIDEYLK